MNKNVTVRTFNREESAPIYKSPTVTRYVGEDDEYPQLIDYSTAQYLNGASDNHKVCYFKKRTALLDLSCR